MRDFPCVWCGKNIEVIENQATMDTCEECEEYFEEHIDDIAKSLNELLLENESINIENSEDKSKYAIRSYSLITAIHMISSKPKIEFKDSKFLKYLKTK